MAAVHLPQYHATLIQPVKWKESNNFAVFVNVVSTLCAWLGTEVFGTRLKVSVPKELSVNVPVTIFFLLTQLSMNHSSKFDTLVNQDSQLAPIRSPVRGRTGFFKIA